MSSCMYNSLAIYMNRRSERGRVGRAATENGSFVKYRALLNMRRRRRT